MNLKAENAAWVEETWKKLQEKISAEADRVGDRIPYIPENGKYIDCSTPEKIGRASCRERV